MTHLTTQSLENTLEAQLDDFGLSLLKELKRIEPRLSNVEAIVAVRVGARLVEKKLTVTIKNEWGQLRVLGKK